MNRLTAIGRIVRDIELRDVGDGRVVLNNAIAIPRTFKSDNGRDTDFINFVAWGKRAELIADYCHKGDQVGFDGRIQSRTYENKENQTVFAVEMVVESVYFLQSRRGNRKNRTRAQNNNVEDIQTANS